MNAAQRGGRRARLQLRPLVARALPRCALTNAARKYPGEDIVRRAFGAYLRSRELYFGQNSGKLSLVHQSRKSALIGGLVIRGLPA